MELTNNPGGQLSFKALCDHCNNTTFQTIVSAEASRIDGKTRSYILSKCTICDGVTLRDYPENLTAAMLPGKTPTLEMDLFEQLWPSSDSFSTDVPERIRTIYEEARQVRRKSPSSFVVQLRRAFEALAKDRKAEGRTLYAQIQWLIEQGQLPSMFADMINIARMIGNMGAHDSEKEVTVDDVEVADRFFKAIIEYIYVAPAFLAKVKGPPSDADDLRD